MNYGVHKIIIYIAIIISTIFFAYIFANKEVTVEFGPSIKSIKQKVRRIYTDDHVHTPKQVKAVYVSQCGASSDKIRSRIEELLDETEINSVIIDIKDYTGTVSFQTSLENANDGRGCLVKDMKSYIKRLHDKGIYVIGRITVFQDPLYTTNHPEQAVQSKSLKQPWKDYKGLHFVDVGARDFWEYIVKLSKEAFEEYLFDELNYDYIRYPSDGPMKDAVYTLSDYQNRSDELEKFFDYLHTHVKVKDKAGHTPVMSADLFGMTTTNYDDLTIGQVLEKALPYFDYIAPMVYPSHYPSAFLGLGNPNKNVYKVVNYSMKKAVERVAATSTKIQSLKYKPITATSTVYKKPSYDKNKLRPWLQDFDYGGTYGVKEIRDQIQAVYDAGLHSWMLWDPSNIYTKEALLSSDNQ